MKTREQIIADYPLTKHLASIGMKGKGQGVNRTANRCPSVQHKPDHYCVTIDTSKQIWFCHDCKRGGSVIDWLMIERNQSAADVLKSLGGEEEVLDPNVKPKIVALYDYTNESGDIIYQAVRMEPKSFRQRRPDGKGGWIWDMEGVTRVLFNLPAVCAAKTVAIAEGEKDCLTLGSFGYVATCNVGGAGKWLPAYADRFKGKDVLIFPDSDQPGRKHGESIVASLDGVANSIKVIPMPEPHKDVTDWVESFADRAQAGNELNALIDRVAHLVKPLPIYSISEMEAIYRETAQLAMAESFNLGKFLPDLGGHIQPMVPGELLLLIADTGVGKTCIMQEMLRAAAPLPSLLFELELPLTLLFERFVQMEVGCYRSDVQTEYREHSVPLWTNYKSLHHVMVCPESGLTTEQIENYIIRSELKFGRRPVVVAVDYVGLINSVGKSRYESVSSVAEEMKKIAKRTNTIILMASQIARPEKKKESLVVNLHDAKDSGSLECSAGIVLGAWRPEKSRLMIKVLKNTSGESGMVVEAQMDGPKMRISPL